MTTASITSFIISRFNSSQICSVQQQEVTTNPALDDQLRSSRVCRISQFLANHPEEITEQESTRRAMYFCASCNVYVKDSSVAEHDQTTAHLLSSSKGVSVRKVWLPETNRGYQLLKSMGWQDNGGLGPTGDGKVMPIATTFKTDRAGVGVQPTAKQARITHFPAHDEQQARMAVDGRSEAQRMQDRLTRKRKQTQQHPVGLSKAQRKLQKQREQRRDRAIGNELYSDGLDGYEEFLR